MNKSAIFSLTAAIIFVSSPAFAHPGHGDDFGLISGFFHPLIGIDHLIALLAIGIWSAHLPSDNQAQSNRLVLPLLIGFMGAGALLAWSGFYLPAIEVSVAVTLLLLGLIIATKTQLDKARTFSIIAVFAAIHGFAHGTELVGHVAGFLGGMMLASTFIFVVGQRFGFWLLYQTKVTPLLGSAIAMAGLGFMI